MNTNEPKGPGSQWTSLDAAKQTVERYERERNEAQDARADADNEVERLQAQLAAHEAAYYQGHPSPCTLGSLCPYCEIERRVEQVSALQQQVAQLREENAQANQFSDSLVGNLSLIVDRLKFLDTGTGPNTATALALLAAEKIHALQAAHTTLRGLVENASYHIEQVEADLHTALNGTRHDPSWIRPIQLSRNERQELYFNCQKQLAAIRATLPREGATSDGGEHE